MQYSYMNGHSLSSMFMTFLARLQCKLNHWSVILYIECKYYYYIMLNTYCVCIYNVKKSTIVNVKLKNK